MWHGTILDQKREGSALLFRRTRFLDPSSGRFTQEDPIGLAGGLNVYGFAHGDPANLSDPFGLCPRGMPICPVIEFTTTMFGGLLGLIGGGGGGALMALASGGVGAPAIPSLAVAGALGGAAAGLGLGKSITTALYSEDHGSTSGGGGVGKAARDWLGQTNRQNPGLNRIIAKWFKEGGDLPGEITREYLINYRAAAQDAIQRGVDILGRQADRIRMIDDALRKMQ